MEAAHANGKWAEMTGHARAQVLYYIAENLSARKAEFSNRLVQMCCYSKADADSEVEKSIDRIYTYAAHADKYDGQAHQTIQRNVTLAMPEPVGIMVSFVLKKHHCCIYFNGDSSNCLRK